MGLSLLQSREAQSGPIQESLMYHSNEDSIEYYRKLIAKLGLFNKNGEQSIRLNSDLEEFGGENYSSLTERRKSGQIPAL